MINMTIIIDGKEVKLYMVNDFDQPRLVMVPANLKFNDKLHQYDEGDAAYAPRSVYEKLDSYPEVHCLWVNDKSSM